MPLSDAGAQGPSYEFGISASAYLTLLGSLRVLATFVFALRSCESLQGVGGKPGWTQARLPLIFWPYSIESGGSVRGACVKAPTLLAVVSLPP